MVLGIGGLLPSVGLEIPCSMYALNVPLQIDALGLVTLDFKGGITVRVEGNLREGLGGIRLRIIGHEVSADSPELGTVTLSQSDIDTTPLSLLEITKTLPPTFRNTIFHDLTLTIEKPPGGGEPWVLSNTNPFVLIHENLTRFPPQGDVYQLQKPVEFAPVGAPDQVVAQIQQFPLTVTHNP